MSGIVIELTRDFSGFVIGCLGVFVAKNFVDSSQSLELLRCFIFYSLVLTSNPEIFYTEFNTLQKPFKNSREISILLYSSFEIGEKYEICLTLPKICFNTCSFFVNLELQSVFFVNFSYAKHVARVVQSSRYEGRRKSDILQHNQVPSKSDYASRGATRAESTSRSVNVLFPDERSIPTVVDLGRISAHMDPPHNKPPRGQPKARKSSAKAGPRENNNSWNDRMMKIIGPMPARIEMLMDMPTVPLDEQCRHAWNPNDLSHNIYMREDDPLTLHRLPRANSTDGVRSKIGYETGIHLFEINWPMVQRGTTACVGVSTTEAPLHTVGYQNLIGRNKFSWGWDLSRKNAIHDKKGRRYPAGLKGPPENFVVPDKFHAILDMDKGVLGFVVNGNYLGAAFDGLQGKRLHLSVSAVWGNCKITMRYLCGLECQPLPLMNLCRHVIRSHMTQESLKTGRVDELKLPKSVKEFLTYNGHQASEC